VQIVREQRARVSRLVFETGLPLDVVRVIDVGCGAGTVLGWLHELGVPAENLFGVDLLKNRIDIARERFPCFTFAVANAEELDLPDASFDLGVSFTVFSSILDDEVARNVAQSMSRVLRANGGILWYDVRYPNPWNPDIRAMTAARIRSLFPDFSAHLEATTIVPPLARRLGRLTDRLYPVVGSFRPLRSHYIGVLTRRASAA
jgi:ubiquinone/menaquinone biosynthesis C-methylase UbiE